MKKDNKQAKFFCESCGKEVKQNAKVCSYCGKFFSSVRCPKCGKTGSNSEFEKGCPRCGYAVNNNFGSNIKNASSLSNGKNHFYFHNRHSTSKKNQNNSSDSLPLWMYLSCIFTLIAIIICLYGCL